mgnify:CR=1 FL=1
MTSGINGDLDRLEAESIHILREVAAECRRPVLLYSIGKDSSVLLHLLLKAFAPARPSIPLLHVDTTWKFREMIAFRDRRVAETGVELLVHTNPDGLRDGIGPLSHGATVHTEIMKTLALKQALDAGRFDAAIGVRVGTKRNRERRSACFRFAMHSIVGIRVVSVQNYGTSTTRGLLQARACACFRCRTGPSWMCGATSVGNIYLLFPFTSRPNARWSHAMGRC